MKKKLLTFFLLILLSDIAFAQNVAITGKVTDQKDGTPLPGVSVTVKGVPGIGTQTQSDGTFNLSVPNASKIIVFKFIGYKEADLTLSGKPMNVQLEPDSKQLTEVVVVGYGTQKRSSITGAITSVSGKEVENTPVTTLEQALQGKTAGVNIQAGNGKLGQE